MTVPMYLSQCLWFETLFDHNAEEVFKTCITLRESPALKENWQLAFESSTQL